VKSPHNHISYALHAEALLRGFISKRYQPLPSTATASRFCPLTACRSRRKTV
jgi:hypothetical protein